MSTVTVQIKGLKQLQRSLQRYPHIAKPILQKAINATEAVLAKHTLKDDPIPWSTGNLLHSFRFKKGNLQARWYPTAHYAYYVHEGTRPHIIRVCNRQVLANRRTGQFFGRVVRHPGTKPNPFMVKLLKKAEPDINKLFQQAGDQIVKRIARSI